jgi:hypothetical protein
MLQIGRVIGSRLEPAFAERLLVGQRRRHHGEPAVRGCGEKIVDAGTI